MLWLISFKGHDVHYSGYKERRTVAKILWTFALCRQRVPTRKELIITCISDELIASFIEDERVQLLYKLSVPLPDFSCLSVVYLSSFYLKLWLRSFADGLLKTR